VDRIPVDSTNIISAGYDPATKTLELEFVKGNIYQYFGVPRSIYEGLMAADSKGAFVNTEIKGSYDYNQV
jgi:KTSC domain-containing protein